MGMPYGTGWSRAARSSANRKASRSALGRYSQKRRRGKPQRVVEYSEYMLSDDWKSRRALYFADSELPKVCLVCGVDEVELHHMTYERLGFELLTDLAPLCHLCHAKLHRMDPDAGRRGGLSALRKSLIYDFGIGTLEVDRLLLPYQDAWKRR